MKQLTKKFTASQGHIFVNRDGDTVRCAFDKSADCSPNCAACHIYSSQPEKAYCLRGSFDIGFL